MDAEDNHHGGTKARTLRTAQGRPALCPTRFQRPFYRKAGGSGALLGRLSPEQVQNYSQEGPRRSRRSEARFALIKGTLMPGKRVQFDDETWAALDLLVRDRMMEFQELADEVFRDLLLKHGRPATSNQRCARAPAKMQSPPRQAQPRGK